MKKIIIAVLILAFALAGCNAPALPEQESSVAESSAVVKDYGYVMSNWKKTADDNPDYKYGYARHDINGDGVEEFFSFRNKIGTELNEELGIFYIHTMKDGEAVELSQPEEVPQHWPFPSADGIFYWNGNSETGGMCGKYKLKSGASEFETLDEYRREVEFFEDENARPIQTFFHGEQAITEDEFYAALDEYEREEQAASKFQFEIIPLSAEEESSEESEWSYSPESGYVIPEIDAPKTYKNVPSEYFGVLENLYKYAKACEMSSEDGSNVDTMGYFYETGFREHYSHNVGYRVWDINSDGVPELITGAGYDALMNPRACAIWTLKDGKPVQVESWGDRYRGVFLEDGTAFAYGSGGADCTAFYKYKLAPHAVEWTELESYYSESVYIDGKHMYTSACEINGRYTYLTRKEYLELWPKFDYLDNNTDLKLTTIL